MTNRTTSNRIILSVAALAAMLVATGTVVALVAQPVAAQSTSSSITNAQTHNCHSNKPLNSPLINSCNDVATGTLNR